MHEKYEFFHMAKCSSDTVVYCYRMVPNTSRHPVSSSSAIWLLLLFPSIESVYILPPTLDLGVPQGFNGQHCVTPKAGAFAFALQEHFCHSVKKLILA